MSYKPSLTGSWWRKHRFFKLYMLREATVLPLAFFICSLLAGVFSLQDPERFAHWQAFMSNPLIIAVHALALLASLYHALTFFVLFPRVMPLRIAGKSVPAVALVAGQWAAVVLVILVFLWLFMGGAA